MAKIDYAHKYVYKRPMAIVWDEAKRQSNLIKHRLDFHDAEKVFSGLTLTFEDDRFEYGERRYVAIGLLAGKFVVIAHSGDDEEIRILSMRKATNYEERIFFNAFRK